MKVRLMVGNDDYVYGWTETDTEFGKEVADAVNNEEATTFKGEQLLDENSVGYKVIKVLGASEDCPPIFFNGRVVPDFVDVYVGE